MNRKQRQKNRATAQWLDGRLATLARERSVCPRCGVRGEYHWVQTREPTVEDMVLVSRGQVKPDSYYGFYTCADLYDETGRRKPEHQDRAFADPFGAAMATLLGEQVFDDGVSGEELLRSMNLS